MLIIPVVFKDPSSVASVPSSFDSWFEAEVRPHEPALRAYLNARFSTIGDIDDIVQEAFSRLCRAQEQDGIRCVKALLFTTARNAALDVCRRRRADRTDSLSDLEAAQLSADGPDAAELASRRQELEILADAVGDLPDRCREVMVLRYRDGLACKEIAARLMISPETVKVHLARGMRACAEYFAKRGLLPCSKSKESAS